MSDIHIKVPSLDFTPVSNVFIDEYISEARGDFVKVYLYCLRLGYLDEAASIEKAASSLNLLQADIMKALEYWENLNVIRITPDGIIEFLPIIRQKKQDSPVYFDKAIKEMFDDIEKLLGRPLSSKEFSVFMHIVEDFGFAPEMIALLVEYCSSRKKTDIRYIEKVAVSWHDSKINSYEEAQRHITKHEDKWNKYRNILNYMGIKDNDISKPQEEFLEKWVLKYNFSNDIILEACKICVVRINEMNFSYIDAILGDWYKNGVKSVNDIKKSEKKGKGSKHAASGSVVYIGERQYDVDKLEKELLGRDDTNEK